MISRNRRFTQNDIFDHSAYRWCSAKTAYSRILYVGNAEMCIYSVFFVKIAVGIHTNMFEVYIPAVTVNKNAQQMHISVIRTHNILQ